MDDIIGIYGIYLLNLAVTVAMFVVLIFRAWIEFRNYRILWEEMEWRRTQETAKRILEAEKDLFMKVDEGRELYDILRHMFKIDEEEP